MDYLSKVAELHKDWLRIALKYGVSKQKAEDIVQEMYIELIEYDSKVMSPEDGRVNQKYLNLPTCQRVLDSNGEVNKLFIWVLIRRCFHKQYKLDKQQKDVIVYTDELRFTKEEQELEHNERAFNSLMDKIEKEKANWHEHHRDMYELFMEGRETWHNRSGKGISVQRLSALTGISPSKVYNTIKNCKERIREAVGEDYTDYLNKDFDKI